MDGWRLEAWTHPRLGTTTFITEIPIVSARLVDRDDAVVDSTIAVPAGEVDVIDAIIEIDPETRTASHVSIIRAFRFDTANTEPTLPDVEFQATQIEYEIADDATVVAKISGPHIKGALDDAVLLPYDYPNNPPAEEDWVYGGEPLADDGSFDGDSEDSAIWEVEIEDTVTSGSWRYGVPKSVHEIDTGGATGGTMQLRIHGRDPVPSSIALPTDAATITANLETIGGIDDVDVVETSAGVFEVTFVTPSTAYLYVNTDSSTGGSGVTIDENAATIAWNADAVDVDLAITALDNVTEVETSREGEGTTGDPYVFRITHVEPASFSSDPFFDDDGLTGGTGTLTEIQGGGLSPSPWTPSTNTITGERFGGYAGDDESNNFDGFRITTPDDIDYRVFDGTGALRVNGLSLFSGAQRIYTGLVPGRRYRFRLRANSAGSGELWRLTVKTMEETYIVFGTDTEISQNAWDLVEVSWIQPAGRTTAVVRFAYVDGATDDNPLAMFIDGAGIFQGAAAATVGEIWGEIGTDLQTDHAPRVRLDWVDIGGEFDATNDSSGTPWADGTGDVDVTLRAWDRIGSDIMRDFQRLGVEYDVVPLTLTTWGLRLWDQGNRGTVRTGDTDPAFTIGAAGLAGGKIQARQQQATNVIARTADGTFVETADGPAVTAFGSIDGLVESPAIGPTSLTAATNAALDAMQTNAFSVSVKVGPDGPMPFRDVAIGDTVNFHLPGRVDDPHARRIHSITIDLDSETWTAEYVASRVFSGMTAFAEQIRRLSDRRRPTIGSLASGGLGADMPPDAAGKLPNVIATSDASAAALAIAGQVLTGTDDQDVINAATNAAGFGNVYIVGGHVYPTSTINCGSARLIGIPDDVGNVVEIVPTGVSAGMTLVTGSFTSVNGSHLDGFYIRTHANVAAFVNGPLVVRNVRVESVTRSGARGIVAQPRGLVEGCEVQIDGSVHGITAESNAVIRGCLVAASGSAVGGTCIGPDISSSGNVVIDACEINVENTSGIGILTGSSSGQWRISDCMFKSSGSSAGNFGIRVAGGNTVITGCTSQSFFVETWLDVTPGTGQVILSGNQITANGTAIRMAATGTDGGHGHLTIVGNHINAVASDGIGILYSLGTGTNADNGAVAISGNWIAATTVWDLEGGPFSITGNVVEAVGQTAVLIFRDVTRGIMVGNQIEHEHNNSLNVCALTMDLIGDNVGLYIGPNTWANGESQATSHTDVIHVDASDTGVIIVGQDMQGFTYTGIPIDDDSGNARLSWPADATYGDNWV